MELRWLALGADPSLPGVTPKGPLIGPGCVTPASAGLLPPLRPLVRTGTGGAAALAGERDRRCRHKEGPRSTEVDGVHGRGEGRGEQDRCGFGRALGQRSTTRCFEARTARSRAALRTEWRRQASCGILPRTKARLGGCHSRAELLRSNR